MNKIHFSISEFCIDENALLPQRIADAILEHHIKVMNPVREIIGCPVFVSLNSGFRHKAWEKSKGRSGNSQHTFPVDGPGKGRGAADYTLLGNKKVVALLRAMLAAKVSYTRIAVYDTDMPFIHCDHASPDGKQRFYTGTWEEVSELEIIQYAEKLDR